MMNRRRFLFTAPPTIALLNARASLWGMSATPDDLLTFHIDANQHLQTIPSDVMGLSYESTQLGAPEFFSPSNKTLVRFFQTLSPQGSLRFGGNTSEFTYFKPDAATKAPDWDPLPTQPKELTPITPEALRNLRRFLDATGWTCIYGLNLGTGTPQRAAEEAVAVTDILGPKLDYLQIGNEPNNYIRYKLRPDTWNEKTYLAEWLSFARAVIQRIPTAKLGGPDMGAERAWMQLFATEAVRELGPNIVAMSDHFYAEGPPTSPESTMHNLLFNKKIDHEIAVMVEAGQKAKLPYRMTEVNSCYSGGKPGVSDTLGSALWAAELTLKLIANGFSGINFHGGSARLIKASLGGQLPGDTVANKEAANSYYTPIAEDGHAGYSARPIFYGMLLAARMSGSTLLGGSFSAPQTALAAYTSLGADGRSMQVALFNKGDAATSLQLNAGNHLRTASVLRLTGAAIDSTEGIHFGGAGIGSDGRLHTGSAETLRRTATGKFRLSMPPASAALVHIR